jgi:hypothetical protein
MTAHSDTAVQGQLERPGFGAFLLPARLGEAMQDKIVQALASTGLEPVMTVEVDGSQASTYASRFRSASDLSRPATGLAEPGRIVFTIDVMPGTPAKGAPFDNLRTRSAQRLFLEVFTGSGSGDALGLTVRSADAWAALREVSPASVPAIEHTIARKCAEFTAGGTGLTLKSYGDRAKIELIEFNGQKAVRKTYREPALDLMRREISVMTEMGGRFPEVPRLLDHGANYLVREFVEGYEIVRKRRGQPQPLPLKHVRMLADFLRRCVAAGWDPIDLKASRNVLFRDDGISVFDFEYWRKSFPASPEQSFCFAGVPDDDLEDRPLLAPHWVHPYDIGWFPYVCLSQNSFLNDPLWLQRIKRPWFIALAYMQWLPRVYGRLREVAP